MAEPSPAIIKKTQDTLGKYVKKPQLTEKLLKKPPFRFLHDVINAVIKETGFLKGLYKPEELVSENVKERDAKISFLQKLIDVTSIATKKSITAKPSKIVAGQEPEKTNELLQIIGMAIQNKVDTKKAIEEWKNKQNKGIKVSTVRTAAKPSGKENKEQKPTAAVVDKIADDGEKKPRVDSGIVEDGTPAQDDSVELLKEPSLPVDVVDVKNPPEDVATVNELPLKGLDPDPLPSSPQPVPKPTPLEQPPTTNADDKQEDELIKVIDEEANRRKQKASTSRKSSSDNLLKGQESHDPSPAQALNGVVKGDMKTTTKKETSPKNKPVITKADQSNRVVRPRTSLRPPSVRPASARPGAPRKRNAEVIVQAEENVQLGDINVKVEHFKAAEERNDDDDDNLIVIENVNIQETLLKQSQGHTEETSNGVLAGDQGQLVKQILESQKEFESVDGIAKGANQNSIHNSVVSELRDQIQKLTKSIQPLGKFMDFLMEDIDSMQREHDLWRERGKEVALKLAREKNSTEGTGQSMRHQLEELDFELQEKYSALFALRENIMQNEDRILKIFKNL